MADRVAIKCAVCKNSPATFQCFCQSPSVQLCPLCVSAHTTIPGSHRMNPPGNDTRGNSICDQCQATDATHFCSCAVPFKEFCDQCGLNHSQKQLGAHYRHPICALESALQFPVADFRKKQQFIDTLNLRYEEHLQSLDQLIVSVDNDFKRLIRQCEHSRDVYLQQLQELREQVVVKVREATDTIQAKRYLDFQPNSELESLILTGWAQRPVPEVSLFTASFNLEPAFTALATCFRLGKDAHLKEAEATDIPVINATCIRLFSPTTLRMRKIPLLQHTQINARTAYCYISPTAVLCCGGYISPSALNAVSDISVTTGFVTVKHSMITARYWTGIFKHQGCVYAIGGYGNSETLATAEKFELSSNTWKVLTGQLSQPRGAMTPCVQNSKAYITGLDAYIEVLDLNSEVFTALPLSLRTQEWSVSVVLEGTLLIIAKKELVQWVIDSAANVRTSAINNPGGLWSNCPPVRIGRNFYYICNKGTPSGIAKLDVDAKRLESLVEFTY